MFEEKSLFGSRRFWLGIEETRQKKFLNRLSAVKVWLRIGLYTDP
jgi:hypothetical protein